MSEEGASTRERLLRAALVTFSERGYGGATTRIIAERAGANQGLVTHYFGGKEKLWKSAVTLAFADLDQTMASATEALTPLDPPTQIRLLARMFVLHSSRHPELHRLVVHESMERTERMRWLVEEQMKPRLEPVQLLLGDDFPDRSWVGLLMMFIGAASHVFATATLVEDLGGGKPTDPVQAAAYADDVVRLFLGEPGTPLTLPRGSMGMAD